MALVADLYGLSVNEAMNLSDKETSFLLEKATHTMLNLAATSKPMQDILRGQLAPTLHKVREARGGGGEGPVGPPNE